MNINTNVTKVVLRSGTIKHICKGCGTVFNKSHAIRAHQSHKCASTACKPTIVELPDVPVPTGQAT